MDDHMRRLRRAQQNVEGFYITPITELLAATEAACIEEKAQRLAAERALEQLRPVWAMGNSDASLREQAASFALSEIWELLGVKDQTHATAVLRSWESRA